MNELHLRAWELDSTSASLLNRAPFVLLTTTALSKYCPLRPHFISPFCTPLWADVDALWSCRYHQNTSVPFRQRTSAGGCHRGNECSLQKGWQLYGGGSMKRFSTARDLWLSFGTSWPYGTQTGVYVRKPQGSNEEENGCGCFKICLWGNKGSSHEAAAVSMYGN